MIEIKRRDLYKLQKYIRKSEKILYKYGLCNQSIWNIYEGLGKSKYYIKQRIANLEKGYY